MGVNPAVLRSFFARPSRWLTLLFLLFLTAVLIYDTRVAAALSRIPVPSVEVTFPSSSSSAAPVADEPPKQVEFPPAPINTDWSRFAYAQYVTNSVYLCNSVMFFEALKRYGSKADRLMMYPHNMMAPDATDAHGKAEAQLLIKARDEYGVKLLPITVQHKSTADTTWADSFTKLLVFNQTQYARILSVDSDSLLLQHMDELFFAPAAPMAMPRAYWLYPEKEILSSQLMLVTPSHAEFARIMRSIKDGSRDEYDMEIVNTLYRDSAVVLPHRAYDMLSAEFRSTNHTRYLGSADEKWDPVAAYNEAKMVHFSDWPVPKPWKVAPPSLKLKHQPKCPEGEDECPDRRLWNSLYEDFSAKRREVCG